ncbi:MAG: tetratricopeptide repeat protein [Rhodothermales bacterium]
MNRTLSALAFLALLLAGLAPTASAQADTAVECTDDENERRIHYSLYYESYKAGDYEAALPELLWILECAPGFGGPTPDDRNIRRGIEVYDSLAVRAEDPAQQQEFIGKALALFEEGPSMLQDDGVEVSEYDYVLRQGRFIQSRNEMLSDQQGQVYDLYLRAFELQPDSLGDYFINFIAGERTRRAVQADTPEEKAATRDYLTGTLMPKADDPAYIQGLMDSLITTPREQYAFLKEKFLADPTALGEEDVKTLFSLNQNPELKDDALQAQLIDVLVEMDPTPSLLRTLARGATDDGDFDEAQRLYERALELAEDPTEQRDIYYNIAVMKQQQGQLATASNFARKALEIDSNHGPSLYILGSAIASSVRGGDVPSRAAYWCAVDYFNRAASDPQVSSAARNAAGTYSRAAPSQEEYFFLGWKPGQSVSASYGWGSCSTTVR